MLLPIYKEELNAEGYRHVGNHSAVKVCGWTKNKIKGKGGCYKYTFYGIVSSQCMQMTTSMSCANRCTFCWRGYKAPVSKEWQGEVDDPTEVLNGSLAAHHKLLVGFKGDAEAVGYQDSTTVHHAALSLTGEPITYPRINEMITQMHERGISTFLVTNAQYPDQIRDLVPVTQLYLSIDAPNRELLKQIDRPLFADFWERFLQSLDYLKEKKGRTAARFTLIKGVNMCDPQGYASLIEHGDPDFVEAKAYMHVGSSREFHTHEQMPKHHEVIAFAQELLTYLPNYEIVAEHIPSRVVMLAKKKFYIDGVWQTWIDFAKFHTLASNTSTFSAIDYCRENPVDCLGVGKDERKEEIKEDIQ